jgi:hypothetical protein
MHAVVMETSNSSTALLFCTTGRLACGWVIWTSRIRPGHADFTVVEPVPVSKKFWRIWHDVQIDHQLLQRKYGQQHITCWDSESLCWKCRHRQYHCIFTSCLCISTSLRGTRVSAATIHSAQPHTHASLSSARRRKLHAFDASRIMLAPLRPAGFKFQRKVQT